ncbi:MAG TPA: ABC transporter permease [Candidatus Acidoferrales bacterium]|nr:ABC transporter permease [Candidatus Acidoferrales bacterium]
MKGALAVCERDVRKFFRQPFLVISTVVGPFLTLVLLGSAFGGAITHAPIAIVQESYGPFSSNFIDILQNQQSCEVGVINCQNSFQIIYVPDIDTAQQMLRKGLVKAIVHIPEGFDTSLSEKSNVIITVTLDNTDPLSAAAIGPGIVQASQQLSSLIQTSTSGGSIIGVDLENVYRTFLYIEFMAPGTFVQSIMFVSIIAGGVQVVNDKERGIIEGYLVTPLKKYEIIIGVLLAGVVKALISAIALFFLAILVVGVRPLSVFPTPDLMGITLTMFTLFLTSLGLIAMMTAYAVRFSTADIYRVSSFPINLTLYYTCGAIYPLDGFPTWMKDISVINPETYAVHALRLLMYNGAGFGAVAGDFAFLGVFTGLMVILSLLAFRRGL